MFGPWTPLIALVATFLLLLWLKRRITYSLQELSVRWVGDPDIALIIYFVIVLPGVIIHELSHWLAAKVLGVRVSKLSIGPVRKGRSRRVSLGSIQVRKVDPLRASLIGMAPLIGGTLIILLIGFLVLDMDQVGSAVVGQDAEGILAELERLVHIPDFWLWLYLIFSVSNAMLPSTSDMDTVRPVLIFLGALTAIIVIATGIPAIPPDVVQTVNVIAGYLASAFALSLAVDVVFISVILLLLWVTRWLQNR
jgi:membrane-associated protease RseP (regulator of RpoE activity)